MRNAPPSLPPQEDLQVLKYQSGQQYRPHSDVIVGSPTEAEDGFRRCATVLMYLSDVEEGGETVFPNGKWVDDALGESAARAGLSECAGRGVAVKPRKGDALLFWSLDPSGKIDEASTHAGCPVVRGEKWSATKWIHVRPFRERLLGGGACEDRADQCRSWARAGECEKNPKYMVGENGFPGACMKACGRC